MSGEWSEPSWAGWGGQKISRRRPQGLGESAAGFSTHQAMHLEVEMRGRWAALGRGGSQFPAQPLERLVGYAGVVMS